MGIPLLACLPVTAPPSLLENQGRGTGKSRKKEEVTEEVVAVVQILMKPVDPDPEKGKRRKRNTNINKKNLKNQRKELGRDPQVNLRNLIKKVMTLKKI